MKELNVLLQAQFDKMCATGKLFRVNVSKEDITKTYLHGFRNDPIFRDPESSAHNCNTCISFLRAYGNVVAIGDDNKLMSIFDVQASEEYKLSMEELNELVTTSELKDVFVESLRWLKSMPYEACKPGQTKYALGLKANHKIYTQEEANMFGVVDAGPVYTFNHLSLDLPAEFVTTSGESKETIAGSQRTDIEVFTRAMEEIPANVYETVLDLINGNALLNGATYVGPIAEMKRFANEFAVVPTDQKKAWAWKSSAKTVSKKFKNTLIGVLCSDIAGGMVLEVACTAWNKRVDPANYKKASAPITQKQKQMAEEFVVEHGYVESLERRSASLDDINTDEIKYIGSDGTVKTGGVSLFDNIKTTSKKAIKPSKKVKEVSIDEFMEDILPSCEAVELLLENRLAGNMVTMTTSVNEASKGMFMWDNNFSWTYSGNLAGKSMLKEDVKKSGGDVTGYMRGSISWAHGSTVDNSDLDIHCKTPVGKISYSHKVISQIEGKLDIDITNPNGHKASRGLNPVENITFKQAKSLLPGNYEFFVRNYSNRNSQGFTAELEINGEIFEYSYNQRVGNDIPFATVTIALDGSYSVVHHLPSSVTSRELYGLDTQKFHKVNLLCLSPNYWKENARGHKHFFFMLDGCQTKQELRGFHNENFNGELSAHRKVLEVLATSALLEPASDQLSGVGFNATVHDEVTLKLKGPKFGMVKVKF